MIKLAWHLQLMETHQCRKPPKMDIIIRSNKSSSAFCWERRRVFTLFGFANILYSFCRFLILRTRQIHIVSISIRFKSSLLITVALLAFGWYVLLSADNTDGSSGSDRNNSEAEPKPKAIPRREAPPKPTRSPPVTTTHPSASQNVRIYDFINPCWSLWPLNVVLLKPQRVKT